jgi:hypothetical protein
MLFIAESESIVHGFVQLQATCLGTHQECTEVHSRCLECLCWLSIYRVCCVSLTLRAVQPSTHGLLCVADVDSLEFASLQWILRCGQPLGSVLDRSHGPKRQAHGSVAHVARLERGSCVVVCGLCLMYFWDVGM